MKTAVKYRMMGLCLLSLSFLANPAALRAQSAPPAATPAPAPTVAATPVSSPGTLANSAPAVMPPAANAQAQEIKIPDLPTPPSGEGKNMKAMDPPGGAKVPDSVKDVIKRLNTKTEDVTLDDLNNAREAVAKLDALIDIEKRLVDLDKIRQEREKANRSTMMASAIPASALTPLPSYTPPPANTPKSLPAPAPILPASTVEVLQIEGSNNRYSALVKDGENTRLVHAGDHLSDDSIVLSVSKRGVELQRSNKIARLIEVKDVQSVFGNNP